MENIAFFDNIQITNAQDDGNALKIEGYTAHWDEANLNRQRVNSKSFDKFFDMLADGKMDYPVLNYNHDSSMLIGKVDSLDRDKNGLFVKAHINKSVSFVRDTLAPMILNGDINKLSTEGFISKDDVEFYDDDTFYIRNFLLSAVAVVATPADWDAEFSVVNVVNKMRPADEEVKKEVKGSRLAFVL